MATRLFKKSKVVSGVKTPQRDTEWTQLMRQTIQRADKLGDRRTQGLRKALADGKAEAHLRRMGVICETDLHREFPGTEK